LKYLKHKTIFSTLSSLGSTLLLRSISILTIPIFTRILTTADFGLVSNYSAIYTILSVVGSISLSSSIGVAHTHFKERIYEYLFSIFVLYFLFVIIILLCATPFYLNIQQEFSLTKELILFMGLSMLFIPSFDIIIEYFRFDYQYKKILILSLTTAILSVLISFLLVYSFELNYTGRIIGIYLPTIFVGIFYYFRIIRVGFHNNLFTDWKYALKISLPMIPHSLGMIVFTQMDRILIVEFEGLSQAGIYSFAITYATLVQIFSNAIMSSFVPWLYQSFNEGKYYEIGIISSSLFWLFALIIFGAVAFSSEILLLLGGANFLSSKSVVIYLCLASFFQFVYSFFSSIEVYLNKTYLIAIGTVIVAIISYFMNFFLIPIYGWKIAAIVTFISYLMLTVVHAYILRRLINMDLFNVKKIFVIFLFLLVLSFIAFYQIDSLFIRIGLFLLLAVILWKVKQKRIKLVFFK
jgi:O-antigen/teichoic acid export membrane protein